MLLSAVDVMDRNPERNASGRLARISGTTLDEMAVILKGGGYPTEIAWNSPEATCPSLRPAGAEIVGDIEDAIVRFANPANSCGAQTNLEPKRPRPKQKRKGGSSPRTPSPIRNTFTTLENDWRGVRSVMFYTRSLIGRGFTPVF